MAEDYRDPQETKATLDDITMRLIYDDITKRLTLIDMQMDLLATKASVDKLLSPWQMFGVFAAMMTACSALGAIAIGLLVYAGVLR